MWHSDLHHSRSRSDFQDCSLDPKTSSFLWSVPDGHEQTPASAHKSPLAKTFAVVLFPHSSPLWCFHLTHGSRENHRCAVKTLSSRFTFSLRSVSSGDSSWYQTLYRQTQFIGILPRDSSFWFQSKQMSASTCPGGRGPRFQPITIQQSYRQIDGAGGPQIICSITWG